MKEIIYKYTLDSSTINKSLSKNVDLFYGDFVSHNINYRILFLKLQSALLNVPIFKESNMYFNFYHDGLNDPYDKLNQYAIKFATMDLNVTIFEKVFTSVTTYIDVLKYMNNFAVFDGDFFVV